MRRRHPSWEWEYPPYPPCPQPGMNAEDAWHFHTQMKEAEKKLLDEYKSKNEKKEDKKPEHQLLQKRFSILELSIWLTLGSVFLGPPLLTLLIKNLQELKLTLQQTLQ